MRNSKAILPDLNVWIALTSRRHVHHAQAAIWMDTMAPEQAIFCRVTQMGLLRLLTNRSVMGVDVRSQAQAWMAYERMIEDHRVSFAHEPLGLDSRWKKLCRSDRSSPNLWTDTYLTAFAAAGGYRLVTFDKALSRTREVDVALLGE